MKLNRYGIIIAIFLLLSIIFCYSVINAVAIDNSVSDQEVIEKPVFLAGDRVFVDGVINGDLYAAGSDIIITGSVNGDIIAAGESLSVSGPVSGNIRLAGRTIQLQGETRGSATLLGQKISLNRNGNINRDAVVFSQYANIAGRIGRHLNGAMESLLISGLIAEDVKIFDSSKIDLQGASIGGNFIYSSPEKASISNTSTIGGKTTWNRIEPEEYRKPFASVIASFFISLAGMLVIWGILKLWRPTVWNELSLPARDNPGAVIGIGLLLLLATPILAILLFITVIGIPAGFILLLTYGTIIYLSRIICAGYLVQLLKPKTKTAIHDFVLITAALILIMLVSKLPYIGWIIVITVLTIGLGSFFKTMFPANKRKY